MQSGKQDIEIQLQICDYVLENKVTYSLREEMIVFCEAKEIENAILRPILLSTPRLKDWSNVSVNLIFSRLSHDVLELKLSEPNADERSLKFFKH